MDLSFLRVGEELVDRGERTFHVRRRPRRELSASIARAGIRAPLLLERKGERYRIVSGWARFEARPPGEKLPALILPDGLDAETLWDVFVRDNEDWGVLEAARVLAAYGAAARVPEARVVGEKMRLLGLHASQDLLRRHLRLLELPAEAQQVIEEEDLPLRKALGLLRLPASELPGLLGVARGFALTFQELGEVLGLLPEIAAREGLSLSRVIEEVASGAGSKQALRQGIFDRRYPELARYRGALEAQSGQLRFSLPVRVTWDPGLERPGIQLAVELADGQALERFLVELPEHRARLAGFFEIL